MLVICSVTDILLAPTITELSLMVYQDFNSSQNNACVVGIGVLGPSEGLGLHKLLPQREFEPNTSHMLGKRRTPRPRLQLVN